MSKKRYIALGMIMVLLVSLFLAACGGDDEEKKEESPILIGGILNTTGIQAGLDEPTLRGAQLAVDEVNRQGGILGRTVEFVNIDGESDPDKVRAAALELIDQGAVALLAPCDFDFGSPASQEAQKAGLVGISTCASSPLYNSKVLGDKQFTISMWNTTMGGAGAEYAFNDRQWTSAYVITDTFIEYTLSLSEFFVKHYESLGGTVVFNDEYSQGDEDLTPYLERLQNLDPMPDMIYISSYMPALGEFIKMFREAGIDLPIMGGDSYSDATLIQALGATYGNEIYYVTHSWMADEVTQDMKHFLTRYAEKYGGPPNTELVAPGWDCIMVLDQAMEAAETTDGHEPDKEAAVAGVTDGVPYFIGWAKPQNLPSPDL